MIINNVFIYRERGASIKFEIISENKTLGIENYDKALLLTATHISNIVLEVIFPFKYLV